ncbi:MAG: DUF2851 family protein [Verrucomicrobiales bacterium]|nr:DUF2851 family protein [Verrucomicrobiales bacterium]
MPHSPEPSPYPAAARQYHNFLQQVFPTNLAEETHSPAENSPESELELQARWFAGEFGRKFTSTDGKKIEIIQFGHWNHSAGPDFTEVAILIDGHKTTGSLEVELEASSWEAHGHGSNPEFDQVVLHVFLAQTQRTKQARFYTRTSEHREVVQLALEWESLDDWGPRPWNHLPEARLGRCSAPLQSMPSERLQSLISAAAQYRLQSKAQRLLSVAQIHGDHEALFQALAEALGFVHNRLAMRVLSQRLPLSLLLKLSDTERETYLFGAAGYIDFEHYQNSQEETTRLYLKELWQTWWQYQNRFDTSEERRLHWHLAGIRPLNHPQRRLAALLCIVNHWQQLIQTLQEGELEPELTIKKLKDYFASLQHPFWNYHYTLRSQATNKSMALVGQDRMQDILGNVLFPWLTRHSSDAWQNYTQLPGSQVNEKLRRACLRLFGSDEASIQRAKLNRRYYFQQQALLQIYNDFCLADSSECQDCPFPEQLSQW